MQNKNKLRQAFLDKRKSVTKHERQLAAQAATALLLKDPVFSKAEHIACYFAQDNEFDCTPLIEAIWRANKNCYLPVLTDKTMQFAIYHEKDKLCLNRYNILEPANKIFLSPEKLDLVLVPLVSFDSRGHRLGMGGGYYDRTFAFKSEQRLSQPFLLGLAYQIQLCPEGLPNESYDVQLNGVLTEQGLFFAQE